jgi:predicted transcriptional regulator of viral defense system
MLTFLHTSRLPRGEIGTHASHFLWHDRLVGDAGRETGIYGRFLGQDHALAALARRQAGVFGLAQLVELGLTVSAVHKRTATGRLYRVHQSVYSLAPPELLSRNGRFMAAVLACGPRAVLSHRSAAALHGLRATDRAGIDVTIPRRSTLTRAGIDVHRSTTLTQADTTEVDGIPCTTIARTLLDLAGVVSRPQQERALNQAEVLEVLDARALDDQLERNVKTPVARKLKAALAEHDPAQAPTESKLEEEFVTLCRRIGLPTPERQAYIAPDDGEPACRVDFLWRAARLVVETDGARYHRTRRAMERDSRRDQRLTLAGWRVVRVTWQQVTKEPATVAGVVAGLLGQS